MAYDEKWKIGVTDTQRKFPIIKYREYYTPSNYKIVVARYKEKLDWLYPLLSKVIVYNKYEDINEFIKSSNYHKKFLRYNLLNVGRESDTYLNYIINNYYNLPDIVMFTQGNTNDHDVRNDTNNILRMIDEANVYGKSIPKKVLDHYLWLQPDWNDPNKPPLLKYKVGHSHWSNIKYKNDTYICFHDWFVKNIKPVYPEDFKVYLNGLFAVKKELILKRPLDFYKNLIKEVNYHINPIEGHFLERSWYYIFD